MLNAMQIVPTSDGKAFLLFLSIYYTEQIKFKYKYLGLN
jgi:hypothetical protein